MLKPLPKKHGRPRCEATRASILKTAYDLLVRDGLAGLSVEAIAKEAQVSKATIYRWWPNRAAVIIDAFFESIVPQTAFPHTACALKDLQRQMLSLAKLISGETGRVIAAIVAESQKDVEIGAAFRKRYVMERRQEAKDVLTRAEDNGEILPGLDFDALIDTLYGPFYYRLLITNSALDEQFIQELCNTVFDGIRLQKHISDENTPHPIFPHEG